MTRIEIEAAAEAIDETVGKHGGFSNAWLLAGHWGHEVVRML